MSEGRYIRHRIPELFGLGAANGGDRLTPPPLGLHPEIARLAAERALAWARGAAIAPDSVSMILVGHGSEDDPASCNATKLQASRIRGTGVFGRVETAFLQQSPHVADVLRDVSGPWVAVGLFAADGVHGGEDVPRIMAENGSCAAAYLGAIGIDPGIPEVIVDLVGMRA